MPSKALQEAYALLQGGDLLAAVSQLEALVEQDPSSEAAHYLLAYALPRLGRFEEAKDHARIASDLSPDNVGHLYTFVQASPVSAADEKIVERLLLAAHSELPRREAVRVQFALGKAMEDLGRYEESARYFVRANALAYDEIGARSQRFNPARHRREIDEIIATYPTRASFLDKWEGSQSKLPVLIIGMMRSGTSLAEQILSCHPEIGGAGESPYWIEMAPKLHRAFRSGLSSPDPKKVAGDYVAWLAQMCPGKPRVCDKLPQNFMSLGTIHATLPNAQAIHCRRDARDVCLSNFTTPFGTPPPFAYSAEDIASVYRDYLRLMDHWRSVLTDEELHEISYEELAVDSECVIRGLLDFLGLVWSDACRFPERNRRRVETPSLWQVRQPIYASSIGRWKRFAPFMGEQIEIWSIQ